MVHKVKDTLGMRKLCQWRITLMELSLGESYNKAYELNKAYGASHAVDCTLVHIRFNLESFC